MNTKDRTTALREFGGDDFYRDPHAAKYRDQLDAHPETFVRLLALLNDPRNEQRLVDAEMHSLPALAGVAFPPWRASPSRPGGRRTVHRG